ncbi:dienelactone hydrolase family protein [Parasediminibacterium paludis]|uniref:Dienelactone hydrolase family protein n=1 Tax=Parasediminibacterium paludis TaxID=908966 RepID=A0ABV8PVV3_9BACT
MKKLLTLTVAAFATAALLSYTFKPSEPAFLSREGYIACYHQTKDQIELDAANPNFAALHMAPAYYKLENPTGTMISFKAEGGDAKGYFIKSKKKTNKWLFVIQEWWGLNDNIKKEAETFSKELGDVNILALDMYDGKVASVPDSAMQYMRNAKSERLEAIVKGGLAYAGTSAKIYTVGWCFGGGWSLQTTLLAGKQAAGCVMYYGRPETNVDRLKTINCDVIGFFANKDQGIPPAAVDAFEKTMKEIGKNITVNRYDAGHGFANPSNPVYDKAATEDAHIKTIAFLKAHM